MAPRPDHAQLLLALMFGAPGSELAQLGAADWRRIDWLAEVHRLQPWLAQRWQDSALPIPTDVLAGWRQCRRRAALTALGQRADLIALVGQLESAGIPSVALKGPWFAWYGYPSAALRPMNDVDVLVAADHVMPAYELLQQAGFARSRPFEHGLAHTLEYGKHLPQLTSPSGTLIELHMRCWTGNTPRPREAAILARARRMGPDDPVRYPAARDLFAHLVIHASVDGRFDCGALAPLDLEMLLRRETLDWPAVLAEAREEGWLRHAALMLTLADRLVRPGLLEESNCPLLVPDEVAETAERLMVQDLATCPQAQFFADLSAAGAGGRLLRTGMQKLLGRSAAETELAPAERDFSRDGGYLPWLTDRLKRSVAAAFERSVRQQAAGYRVISAWCGSPDVRDGAS